MDYTICEKVLENAKTNLKYVAKLLMPFADDSKGIRVIINPIILDRYYGVAKEGKHIYDWIDLMDKLGQWKELKCEENNNIFIETCRKSHDKILIVCEKEDYEETLYDKLKVYNKDEAINSIKEYTINVYGNNNMNTFGPNSPNTRGNLNTINENIK